MKLENLKNSKYGKIVENFISLFTLQGLNYLLPLITVPYLTRTLGAENYGKTIFAMSIITYFQVVSDYGFNMSATRNISINREEKGKIQEIFSNVITIKSIISIVGLLVLTVIIFNNNRLRQDIWLYYFTYLSVIGYALFPVWLFQGLEQMKYITYLNVIIKTISTVSIFFLIKSTENYVLLPLINSSVLVLISIISLIFIRKNMNVKFVKPTFLKMKHELKDGWHIFITSFFSNVLSNSGNFIVGVFLGDTMVGYYGAIDKITKAIVSMFSPITTAIFPHVNRILKENKEEGIKEILRVGKVIVLLATIVAVGMVLTSKLLIFILCGKEYITYSSILKIQSIWLVLSILNNFIGVQFLIGIGEGKYYSRSFIISGVIMILFDLIFVNIFNVYTIPLSMVLAELILNIIMIYFIRKKKLTVANI